MPRETSCRKPPGGKSLPLPELSDETAYLMQFFLEDFYLWFSCAYATQIRRYRQPWYDGPRQSPYQSAEPLDDPF
ncbi:hypothetical protein WK57_16880 [Burkholderia ubonensis]|uniref:Uncharacterized protein n=1 Tax=Burkholderia ubonensis TaxID=101571 RepID=A0A119F9F3_9BURK|nr:hypothetical protein [Burkholderia ubonensis]KVZ39171.1 hypothetical protein WL16_32210 [Burkholderia ubonensis]KWA84929.1 hypothetical protein WL29_17750 [Burkholderia ubonensis]KWC06154.1 hypothetical protein WL43_17920 [Burkholderia ubonensis]KWZ58757.1 hypothetical protein WK57_16880 [Burkholderia ubonensis]